MEGKDNLMLLFVDSGSSSFASLGRDSVPSFGSRMLCLRAMLRALGWIKEFTKLLI